MNLNFDSNLWNTEYVGSAFILFPFKERKVGYSKTVASLEPVAVIAVILYLLHQNDIVISFNISIIRSDHNVYPYIL
jgi:hypothetical protein